MAMYFIEKAGYHSPKWTINWNFIYCFSRILLSRIGVY
ncbi:hypothetical protein [Azospirillum argentinense]